MPKGVPNKRYTPEFKKLVVETMMKEKMSYRETARQFEISNHHRVQDWERIYLTEGPEGLAIERRGRSSKGRPPNIVVEKSILSRNHPSDVSASCENAHCTGGVSTVLSCDTKSFPLLCNTASSCWLSGVFLWAVFILGSSGSVCVFCVQAQSDNNRTSASNSANMRLGVIFIATPFRIFRFGRNRLRRIRCGCSRRRKSCAQSSGWRSSYG